MRRPTASGAHPSRRAILAGIPAAAIGVGVVSATAYANSPTEPDALLIALREEFDEHWSHLEFLCDILEVAEIDEDAESEKRLDEFFVRAHRKGDVILARMAATPACSKVGLLAKIYVLKKTVGAQDPALRKSLLADALALPHSLLTI